MATKPAWRCANPHCSTTRNGQQKGFIFGTIAPGSDFETAPCQQCKWVTFVAVDSDGCVTLRARRSFRQPDTAAG